MTTGARQRRSPIEFFAPTRVRTPLGTWEDGDPTSLGKARAKVLYGSGSERREAGRESAGQSATFRCLSTAKTRSVTTDSFIRHRGDDWDIVGIAPIDRVPAEIEFTATREAPR